MHGSPKHKLQCESGSGSLTTISARDIDPSKVWEGIIHSTNHWHAQVVLFRIHPQRRASREDVRHSRRQKRKDRDWDGSNPSSRRRKNCSHEMQNRLLRAARS